MRAEQDLQHTAEVLQAACDQAAPYALTLATENTLGLEDNLKLLAAVGRPNLRVLLDTQNPFMWGHAVPALVAGLWPHLSDQVHVKDGLGAEMGNAVLGQGEAGFLETAQALRARAFDGWLISENDYHGERRSLAARDIAVLAGLFDLTASASE
jgi:sugar phosphate isomerase/epimerase